MITKRQGIDVLVGLAPGWFVGGYGLLAGLAALLPVNDAYGGVAYRCICVAMAGAGLWLWISGRVVLSRNDAFVLAWLALGVLGVRLTHTLMNGHPLPLESEGVRFSLIFYGTIVLPSVLFVLIPQAVPAVFVLKWAFVCCVLAVGVVGPASLAFARSYASLVLGRASTENIGPISVGHLGVTCLIIAGFAWSTRSKLDLRLGWVLIGVVILSAGGLVFVFFSGSRGALLAVSLVFVVACIRALVGRIRLHALVWPIVVCIAFVVPLRFESTGFFSTKVGERILFSDKVESNPLSRKMLIPNSLHEAWKNPFWGRGMVEPLTREYPHNWAVEAFLVGGMGLVVVIVVVVCYALYWAFRLACSESEWAFAGFLFLQQCVYLSTSSSLYLLESFWAMLFVVIGSVRSGSLTALEVGRVVEHVVGPENGCGGEEV